MLEKPSLAQQLRELVNKNTEAIWLHSSLKSEVMLQEERLERITVLLTPEGGWPGKNEAERKAVKDAAFQNSAEWKKANASLAGVKERLEHVRAELDVFAVKFRAVDLFIRDQNNVLADGISAAFVLFDPEYIVEDPGILAEEEIQPTPEGQIITKLMPEEPPICQPEEPGQELPF